MEREGMAIEIKTLRAVGASLKRRATKAHHPVQSDFLIELLAYSRHPVLDVLTDEEQRVVAEAIGISALDRHAALDVQSIRSTVRRVCQPTGTYDPCYHAAQNILLQHGRSEAATRIEQSATALRTALGIKKP